MTLLTAAVFTLGSLDVPLHPEQGNAFVILFALSTLHCGGAAGFRADPHAQLGAPVGRAAQRPDGIALQGEDGAGRDGRFALPVVFMFFFSYALVNRTLNAWFPRPLEIANEQSQMLLQDLASANLERLRCHRGGSDAATSKANTVLLGLSHGRWTRSWIVARLWTADDRRGLRRSEQGAARAPIPERQLIAADARANACAKRRADLESTGDICISRGPLR